MKYFFGHAMISISLVISNKEGAGVLKRADEYGVSRIVLTKKQINDPDTILDLLQRYEIDFIVLAGFLLLVPSFLVVRYNQKILNIHPALLPQYGGKGMYGKYVHEAVKAAGEKESGMTIHFVNEKYDDGAIVFQARVKLAPSDSPDMIARKVLALEHAHYPRVIESVILSGE